MSERLTKEKRDEIRNEFEPHLQGEPLLHTMLKRALDECDALERERDGLRAMAVQDANERAELERERDEARATAERAAALALSLSDSLDDAEREEHRNEIDQIDSESQASMELLCDLLAVIHRDGGQHTAKVGVGQSCADARRIVADSHDLEKDRDQWRKMATEEHWFERAQVAERECASRMKRIYETQREEPSDPIGRHLRRLRHEAGLSQPEVAERMEPALGRVPSQCEISYWENGRRRPYWSTIEAFAAACGARVLFVRKIDE